MSEPKVLLELTTKHGTFIRLVECHPCEGSGLPVAEHSINGKDWIEMRYTTSRVILWNLLDLASQLAAVQGELAEARKALATVDNYSDVSNIFGALLDSDASGLYAHLCDQIALARGAAQPAEPLDYGSCPSCGGSLRLLATKSEPEEIRHDRSCNDCGRVYMSTKSAYVWMRGVGEQEGREE